MNITTRFFDPGIQYNRSYMSRMRSCVTGIISRRLSYYGKVIPELGCTAPDLRLHIQKQFKEGMRWNNHGWWEVDHIQPCFWFDQESQKDVFRCSHWSNLRPIWCEDNSNVSKEEYANRPYVDYENLRYLTPVEFWSGQLDNTKSKPFIFA